MELISGPEKYKPKTKIKNLAEITCISRTVHDSFCRVGLKLCDYYKFRHSFTKGTFNMNVNSFMVKRVADRKNLAVKWLVWEKAELDREDNSCHTLVVGIPLTRSKKVKGAIGHFYSPLLPLTEVSVTVKISSFHHSTNQPQVLTWNSIYPISWLFRKNDIAALFWLGEELNSGPEK